MMDFHLICCKEWFVLLEYVEVEMLKMSFVLSVLYDGVKYLIFLKESCYPGKFDSSLLKL